MGGVEQPAVLLRSVRRGRVFAGAAAVGAALSVASWFLAEHDLRLVLLPAATAAWLAQWLLARRSGVRLGDGWVEVLGGGVRAQRLVWADVVSVDVEPWFAGRRLRLWTPDVTVRTPSLTHADAAAVLAAYETARELPPGAR